MDAAGVALVLIGPGSVDQVRRIKNSNQTLFISAHVPIDHH